MFDIGFSEIFVIAVVALLVLGPERLPKAARFTGLWVRRARAQWYSVKSEFERELADDELKRSLRDMQDDIRDAGRVMRDGGERLKRDIEGSASDVRDAVRDATGTLPDANDPPTAAQGDGPRDDRPGAADEKRDAPRA